MNNNAEWSQNVIIADADYVDSVAFNLIVNFERMIGRHIPQADMAQWAECIAMDGGATKGDCNIVLVHDKNKAEMNNFNPGQYESQLRGQAFKTDTQEFSFTIAETDEHSQSTTKIDAMADVLSALADEPQVKRIMIIPNLEVAGTMDILLPILRHFDRNCDEKRITLFGMEPISGVPCRTEILGYSLMAALGIRAQEIAP